jgi:hypothetical protein
LQALAAPLATSRELLLACIRDDPRWDRQLDSRGSYYANLFQSLRLDVSPLLELLREREANPEEASRWLILEILGLLSRKGDGGATTILRNYLEGSDFWSEAIFPLLERRPASELSGLDRVVCRRCPDDEELAHHVCEGEPWRTWSNSNPRIATALRRAQIRRIAALAEQSPNRFTGCSLPELFAQVSRENWLAIRKVLRTKITLQDLALLESHLRAETPWQCKLALAGLCCLDGEGPFLVWKRFVEAGHNLPPMLRMSCSLVARSVTAASARETGRSWFQHPDEILRALGQQLLVQTSTPEELPLLQSAVAPALETGDMYALCRITEALERIGSPSAWNVLALAFQEMPYSYGRHFLARAMFAGAPDRFTEEVAGSALWDCEPDVRETACGVVNPSSRQHRRRLEELASDPQEDADIRRVASRHLAVAEQTPADAVLGRVVSELDPD